MADHDVLTSPQHWRECAQKTLAMARDSREAERRAQLLKVARSYERMAVRAQDWTPKPDHQGS